jgi:hypothetical protein
LKCHLFAVLWLNFRTLKGVEKVSDLLPMSQRELSRLEVFRRLLDKQLRQRLYRSS